VIGLVGSGGLQTKEETFLLPADNNVAIFNESGQEISNLASLVNQILRSPKAAYQSLETAQDLHRNFTLHSPDVTVGKGDPIFLRFDTPNQRMLRHIDSVTISEM
jgi:hypothetical protein